MSPTAIGGGDPVWVLGMRHVIADNQTEPALRSPHHRQRQRPTYRLHVESYTVLWLRKLKNDI